MCNGIDRKESKFHFGAREAKTIKDMRTKL